jgi:hypothetical protein
VLVAGEPGGGEPAFRAKLVDGWGARVADSRPSLSDDRRRRIRTTS